VISRPSEDYFVVGHKEKYEGFPRPGGDFVAPIINIWHVLKDMSLAVLLYVSIARRLPGISRFRFPWILDPVSIPLPAGNPGKLNLTLFTQKAHPISGFVVYCNNVCFLYNFCMIYNYANISYS
jgi:hypothetical protein